MLELTFTIPPAHKVSNCSQGGQKAKPPYIPVITTAFPPCPQSVELFAGRTQTSNQSEVEGPFKTGLSSDPLLKVQLVVKWKPNHSTLQRSKKLRNRMARSQEDESSCSALSCFWKSSSLDCAWPKGSRSRAAFSLKDVAGSDTKMKPLFEGILLPGCLQHKNGQGSPT